MNRLPVPSEPQWRDSHVHIPSAGARASMLALVLLLHARRSAWIYLLLHQAPDASPPAGVWGGLSAAEEDCRLEPEGTCWRPVWFQDPSLPHSPPFTSSAETR